MNALEHWTFYLDGVGEGLEGAAESIEAIDCGELEGYTPQQRADLDRVLGPALHRLRSACTQVLNALEGLPRLDS
jgi:hypothetical protein